MIVLRNVTNEEIIVNGKLFRPSGLPDSEHQILKINQLVWSESSEVISLITEQKLRLIHFGNLIQDVNESINILKGTKKPETQSVLRPFATKTLTTGEKLFRRKLGKWQIVSSNSTEKIIIGVPYSLAKFNKIEVVNCAVGDSVNLKVYDNINGTVQQSMGVPSNMITPNLMLNQFGFNVAVPNGYYEDESNYDADVVQGMLIEIEYTNNSNEDRQIGVNITLHEIRQ